jgi:hypothetical protein
MQSLIRKVSTVKIEKRKFAWGCSRQICVSSSFPHRWGLQKRTLIQYEKGKEIDQKLETSPFLVIIGPCDGGGVVQRCAFLVYLYVISNFLEKEREHTCNEQKVVSNVKKGQKKLLGDQSSDGNDNMVV